MGSERRIDFIDALRGIAILSVILYHGYGPTHVDHLPFVPAGDEILTNKLSFGVELFFMISGFVIFMTLEKCSSLTDFLFRRWSRLFPAMLAASLIILFFDYLVQPSIDKHTPVNLLPGLTFISPQWIHFFTRLNIDSMDTPFWTIYVEFTFYIVFGCLWFMTGIRLALFLLFLIYAVAVVCQALIGLHFGGALFARIAAAMEWTGLIYFGWFSSGTLFYQFFKTLDWRAFVFGTGIGLFTALTWVKTLTTHPFVLSDRIAMVLTVAIFATAIISASVQRILSNRGLLFVGFISYPLYLLHDHIGVTIADLSGRNFPAIPVILVPLVAVPFIFLSSWVIAKWLEPPARIFLRRALHPARKKAVA